jgi:hypothetical protein
MMNLMINGFFENLERFVQARGVASAMEKLVSSVLDPGSPLPSFFEMFMTHQIKLGLKPAAHHLLG